MAASSEISRLPSRQFVLLSMLFPQVLHKWASSAGLASTRLHESAWWGHVRIKCTLLDTFSQVWDFTNTHSLKYTQKKKNVFTITECLRDKFWQIHKSDKYASQKSSRIIFPFFFFFKTYFYLHMLCQVIQQWAERARMKPDLPGRIISADASWIFQGDPKKKHHSLEWKNPTRLRSKKQRQVDVPKSCWLHSFVGVKKKKKKSF